MQVKVLKSEGLNHEIEVTIGAAEIDKKVDEKLQEVGQGIKLPGFRPGKVPLPLLKKRYGKSVLGEVLESAVNDGTAKALEDNGLRAAVRPDVKVKEFDEGKDLVYTVAVEVLPKIEVMDIKTLEIEKPVAKVEPKSVDEALERIASRNRDTVPVTEPRDTKNGDYVVIDFKGRTADGTEYPGMEGKGHKLELGGGQFIPGFEEQLIGKKTGDKVEVKVTFPDPYQMEALAGADAIFDVEITELHEPVDAKIDDEFAKKLGMESLEALRKVIEEQIQREYDGLTRLKVKRALLDALDERHRFDIPQGMHDLEFKSIMRQVEMEQGHDHAHDDPNHVHGPDCDHGPEITEEDKAELKDIAARRVRLGLVLSEIGRANNITVSDPEVTQAVIQEAQRYPGQERQVFDFFRKNRQALESLKAPVFEEKVVNFILELAKVTEVVVTPEDLAAEEDDEILPSKKEKKGKGSSSKSSEKSDAAESNKTEKKPAAKKSSGQKKS